MRNLLAFAAILLIICGCGGKGTEPTPVEKFNLGKPTLLTPELNQPCAVTTIISDAESTVPFTWKAVDYAESYDVVIRNLLTGTSVTQTVSKAELSTNLARNVPYSWTVTAKAASAVAPVQSDVWKFYNPGPGIVSYVPFPAEIVAPLYGDIVTGTTVDLKWKGASPGNNVKFYGVYLGTTTAPPLIKSNLADSFLNAVPIASGTVYYWRVVTVDSNNNYTDSGLYQFSVK